MSRRRVQHEASAGVIVFSDGPDSVRRWLTLQHAKNHWDYPKGHVEGGETARQAAMRELREETGLSAGQVELIDGFERSIT